MEFLRSSKRRRSSISEIIYVLLNVALAAAVLGMVLVIQSPLPAIGLVLLSKWRVLAVRPRYWGANIQANLVDLIVSISIVTLMAVASGALLTQIILAVLYAVWLLLIKPRSKRSFMAVQAGLAIFLGVETLFSISFGWPSWAVVAGMWLIGYAASRHMMESYEEAHKSFYSLIGGLLFAQLGWLFYHWTFAYTIPGANLAIAQGAIICLALGFFAHKLYDTTYHQQKVRTSDMVLPALLSGSIVIVLLVFFNTLRHGGL